MLWGLVRSPMECPDNLLGCTDSFGPWLSIYALRFLHISCKSCKALCSSVAGKSSVLQAYVSTRKMLCYLLEVPHQGTYNEYPQCTVEPQ